jgi:hypothetical protein
MLPTKVIQFDYQDVANLVWNTIDDIKLYSEKKNIEFKGIIAKSRNGLFPGSILANELQLPLNFYNAPRAELVCDKQLFLTDEMKRIYDSEEKIDLLFVDSICGTGDTLNAAKEYIQEHYPKINIHTYVTICDKISEDMVDIISLVTERYIQPPWEWKSYTPQSHLDRLLNGTTKGSKENIYALGYSSQRCKDSFLLTLQGTFEPRWEIVFDLLDVQRNLPSTSGVANLEVPNFLTFEDAKGKYQQLLEEKKKFIFSNGLTHYIEDDWVQAVILSRFCPTTHIIYFDGEDLVKVYAKPIEKEGFTKMYN